MANNTKMPDEENMLRLAALLPMDPRHRSTLLNAADKIAELVKASEGLDLIKRLRDGEAPMADPDLNDDSATEIKRLRGLLDDAQAQIRRQASLIEALRITFETSV